MKLQKRNHYHLTWTKWKNFNKVWMSHLKLFNEKLWAYSTDHGFVTIVMKCFTVLKSNRSNHGNYDSNSFKSTVFNLCANKCWLDYMHLWLHRLSTILTIAELSAAWFLTTKAALNGCALSWMVFHMWICGILL